MPEGKEGYQPSEDEISDAESHMTEREKGMSEVRDEMHEIETRKKQEDAQKAELKKEKRRKLVELKEEKQKKLDEDKSELRRLNSDSRLIFTVSGGYSRDISSYYESLSAKLREEVGDDWYPQVNRIEVTATSRDEEDDGVAWKSKIIIRLKNGRTIEYQRPKKTIIIKNRLQRPIFSWENQIAASPPAADPRNDPFDSPPAADHSGQASGFGFEGGIGALNGGTTAGRYSAIMIGRICRQTENRYRVRCHWIIVENC